MKTSAALVQKPKTHINIDPQGSYWATLNTEDANSSTRSVITNQQGVTALTKVILINNARKTANH
jgi:hypothetical protein